MTNEIDLQASFIAKDGLEYGCFADYLAQEPLHSWRNEQIQALRATGKSENLVRAWIEGWDTYNPACKARQDHQSDLNRSFAAAQAVLEHLDAFTPAA